MLAKCSKLATVAAIVAWTTACSSGGGGATTDCSPGEAASCFADGATMAIGICTAGEQTCQSDGSWGSCLGAGTPAVEDCSDPRDEDCDGFSCSEPSWAMQFGAEGEGGPRVDGLATADDGSIYVISGFSGSLTIGGRSIASVGGSDVLVLKLDGEGSLVWANHYGTPGNDQINGLAIDSEGNIVIAGSTTGNIALGGAPIEIAGDSDIFLAKLDPDGNHLASTHGSTHLADDAQLSENPSGEKYVRDLVLLADDSVVLVGSYIGNWGCLTNSPACTPVDPSADLAAYVQKYSADFVPDWRSTYDSAGRDDGLVVALGGDGGVVWAGRNTGSFVIAGVTLPAAGAFVAGTSAAGDDGWAVHFADADPRDASHAANGEAVVALIFEGATTVDGDPLVSDGRDSLVVRFGASGDIVSYFHPVAVGNDSIRSVVEGDDGSVILTGYYEGTLNLGGGDLMTPNSTRATFVTALTATYEHRWSKGFSGSGTSLGNRVRQQPDGLIIVGGDFQTGSIDFGTGALSTTSVGEAFVAAFQP